MLVGVGHMLLSRVISSDFFQGIFCGIWPIYDAHRIFGPHQATVLAMLEADPAIYRA